MAHKVEVFSAGCGLCADSIARVKKLAGSKHEVVVHEMQDAGIAERAAGYGVRGVPAVVIDGVLAGCCANGGIDESVLRETLT